MKKLITILDGALDEFLGGQTPLMQADIKNINNLLKCGEVFRLNTVPKGEDINSKNANMTILGIANRLAVPGRPVLEALALGLKIPNDAYVYRLNLLSLSGDGDVVSTVGGGVTKSERAEIKQALDNFFKPLKIRVYDLYEHAFLLMSLVKIGGLNTSNITGQRYDELLKNQPEHLALIEKIERVFSDLDLNVKRAAGDRFKIDSALIWGESSFNARTDLPDKKGAVISATPIVKALAKCCGYDLYSKPEFTGDESSDILGKAELSLKLLEDYDTVFCHIDGLDYVSHKLERSKKTQLLSRIDKDYFGTLTNGLNKFNALVELIVLPDHGTSSLTGSHIYSIVPGFKTVFGSVENNDLSFNENLAKNKLALSPDEWIELRLIK